MRTVWAVMKVMGWEVISFGQSTMMTPDEGTGQPQGFIPIFNTYLDAKTFAGKRDQKLIVEMKAGEEEHE
jgi:hypothetical protein